MDLNQGPSAYQSNTLPLDQTGWQRTREDTRVFVACKRGTAGLNQTIRNRKRPVKAERKNKNQVLTQSVTNLACQHFVEQHTIGPPVHWLSVRLIQHNLRENRKSCTLQIIIYILQHTTHMRVMTRPRRGLQGSGDTAQIWYSIVVLLLLVFLK